MLVHFIDRVDDFVLNNAYKIHNVLRKIRCKIVDISYRNEKPLNQSYDDYDLHDPNDYH